ncbi:carboxypeptidase regulatory-like domain-containing protein [Streptomyces sp. NPDC055722]
MIRLGRLRATATILISVCLGLFAATQAPAAAAASTVPIPQTASHQPANTPGAQAAPSAPSTKPAPQKAGYEPAGCYTPTPKKGTASCFALVRTTGDLRTSADSPPSTAVTPADLQAAYRLPATGQGQTVAIVDAYGYSAAEADLAVFRQQYGLPACTTDNGCLRKVDQRGGTDYPPDDVDWSTETSLDLDAVSSACPACHILLVEADSNAVSNLGASVRTAVALGAKFVSNSYGVPDAAAAGHVNDADYDHPGVVVTASTGDIGNAIEWPSSDPNVVAVGGTSLTAAPGTSRGWTETAWSKAGSGCSSFEPQPVYQSNLATGCANKATADISADADPISGLAEYDSLEGGWAQVGGTSLASPLIASMYALAGAPAAGTYPVTYPYVHAGSGLFDVTAGSNGSCGNALCTAGPGWDGPTGLGTPNGVASLTMGAQGTVTGKVTDKTSGAPLAGVPVVATDSAHQLTFRAVTDSTGRYQVGVCAGTYEVSVSKFGYGTAVVNGVVVAVGRSTTADLALTKTPEHTVRGKVTDLGHGWPLYAKLTVPGDPDGPVYTDPVTGTYSMTLPEQAKYTLTVAPEFPGYAPSVATVAVGKHNLHRDLSAGPDRQLCTAPGYAYPAQADFDGWTTAAKYGWTVARNGTATAGWRFDDPGHRGNLTGSRGAGGFATADPVHDADAAMDTDLTSPVFSLVGQKDADLRFNAATELATGSQADVSLTVDGGRTWKRVYQAGEAAGAVDVPLTQALGHSQVQVRFHFSGEGESYFQLSDVSVGRCRTLGGGLIEGRVTDTNTHQPLDGATVTDSSAPATDLYATTTSATDPDDANLPGGFYWLYSPNAGTNSITTTAARYTTDRSAVSASGAIHTYNPVMKAGRLKVTPAKVSLASPLGDKASKDITLTNTGTAPLKVSLFEQNAGPHATPPAAGDGAWQSLPDYPAPVIESVVGSYAGRTYSVGGTTDLRGGGRVGRGTLLPHGYVYDPVAGSWSQIADLPQLRTAATGAFVNGTLYVVGGLNYPPTGGSGVRQSTTFAYHPDTDTWSQVADLPQAVDLANAAVLDGKLYVIGGETATGSSAAAYRYDPAGNAWTRIADYPIPMDSGGCGGTVDTIVCAGGESVPPVGFAPLTNTYVYHPKTDTWTRAADMPYGSYLGAYNSANGELQVAGGKAVGPGGLFIATDRAVQYDPVGDVWTDLPRMPQGFYGAGRGTGCGLALVGGGLTAGTFGTTGVTSLPGFDQCGGDDVTWLSESSTTVTLAPGHSARVRVTADAGVLASPGDHAARLSMITDSPYLTPAVPVSFTTYALARRAGISGTVSDAATGNRS